jgi:hypothetical protein
VIRYMHIFCLLLTLPLFGAEWFVAVNGRDSNVGSIDHPFGSISRAQQSSKPGDTVYVRGGRYKINESEIAKREKIWAYVILLDKSGKPGRSISYIAYRDERPVFDFSEVKPDGLRVHAFEVKGSWLYIKGLEVVGVQVTVKTHTQSICFSNNGSNNIYEQLSMHDGQAIGLYSVRGANNLFLNCDAYKNHDYISEDKLGGNVDGFGCHPRKGYTNNVFRGCRAWFNSDDGYDCINAHEAVVFENCWAFYNGYSPEFKSLKDGNGFKAGGYGSTPVDRVPDPAPRHVVRFCLAVRNKAYGFYANHHTGGSDWINNSAYMNKNNFNMLCRLKDNKTDVPGYGHKMNNNIGYKSSRREEIIQIERSECDLFNNSFQMDLVINANDFASLDEKLLLLPRNSYGGLPNIDFMRSVSGRLVEEGALVE